MFHFLLRENYLATIRKSAGSRIFQNLFVQRRKHRNDILLNGNLSCAYFVSSILYLFDLIREKHATVSGTIRDLQKSGWAEIRKPVPGAILVYEEKCFVKDRTNHPHIGFFIGEGLAISNREEKRYPEKHHWTFGTKNGKPIRKVAAIYWNRKLQN